MMSAIEAMPDFGEAAMKIGCCSTKPMAVKSRGSSTGRFGATPGPPGSARNTEVAGIYNV